MATAGDLTPLLNMKRWNGPMVDLVAPTWTRSIAQIGSRIASRMLVCDAFVGLFVATELPSEPISPL